MRGGVTHAKVDERDTKGTFGKPPQNWNGISRFVVRYSDVTKGSLTVNTFPVLWWFSKGAFSVSLVHFSMVYTLSFMKVFISFNKSGWFTVSNR